VGGFGRGETLKYFIQRVVISLKCLDELNKIVGTQTITVNLPTQSQNCNQIPNGVLCVI